MQEPKGYEHFPAWMNADDIVNSADALYKQARLEIEYSQFRDAVEKEKQRLLTKKPWYVKLFPFRINLKIERI